MLAELAHEADETGWDGFFIWDHLLWTDPTDQPVVEPWVAMTAIAMATERIRFGPMVTPLPRRRPWQLARQAASLDRLSGGRLILGVGIGGDWYGDYRRFSEPTNPRAHGAMLDEALTVLAGLWSGEPFRFRGDHYSVEETRFLPTPVQQPRIPVWVAGRWPGTKPFRRAARWDGVFPLSKPHNGPLETGEYRDMLAYIRQHRQVQTPFDVVTVSGPAESNSAEISRRGEAGVTWWCVGLRPGVSTEQIRDTIRRGSPPYA